jgi:hypothetical protein
VGDKAQKYVLGKPGGKRQFVKPRPKWRNDLKFFLEETGWEGVEMNCLT